MAAYTFSTRGEKMLTMPPETVLVVHVAHLTDAVAGCIVDNDLWNQEYLTAEILQTSVELVVLVTHEVCVEESRLLKHLSLITPEGHGICLHDLRGADLMHRAANAERMAGSQGDGMADGPIVGRLCVPHASHVVGIKFVEVSHQFGNIVGGIGAMPVNTHDYFSCGSLQTFVQGVWHHALRVVEQLDEGVFFGIASYDICGMVVWSVLLPSMRSTSSLSWG